MLRVILVQMLLEMLPLRMLLLVILPLMKLLRQTLLLIHQEGGSCRRTRLPPVTTLEMPLKMPLGTRLSLVTTLEMPPETKLQQATMSLQMTLQLEMNLEKLQ